MLKVTIDNEEVLCNKDFTINEEMLNTSSTILNNVYPVEWEEDKDYVSRFYYPKDYSKCKIFDEIYHPETKEEVDGTSFSIEVDTTKQYQVQTLKGQTTQSGTPTPTSPQPINITTGRQVVSVVGKNLFSGVFRQGTNANTTTANRVYCDSNYYIEQGKTYTFSTNMDTSVYRFAINISATPFPSSTLTYDSGWKRQASFTFTASVSGYLGVPISRVNNANFTPSEIEDIEWQLEKGNQATTYEEYKGNDYEINLGKNLFDKSIANLNKGVSTSTGGLYNSDTNFATDYTPITPGTYVVNGFSSSANRVYGAFYNGAKSYLGAISTSVNVKTFTITNSEARYIRLTGQLSEIDTYQLEKGTGTSYSPYKTPIYLGEMRNTNNVVIAKDYIFQNTTENPLYDSNLEEGQWYIHKEIGKVVLNGSENYATGSLSGYYRFQTTLSIPNKELPNEAILLSNNFKGISFNNRNTQTNETCFMTNGNLSFNTNVANSGSTFKTWLSTHNTEVYYVLNTPTNTLIEDEELISQLNSIELLEGLNNVSVSSADLPFIMSLLYNYAPEYTEEDLYFCGVVENTGSISLNPRYPHYCNLQILDFKHFLSIGETLDFVIYEKTIEEAIDQVISVIAPYGFVKGNINILHGEDVIGAYSTKDKTAYDVFNYIADITQSRWTTRMIDENTIAIDFYDPTLMPSGTAIEYNQNWFCDNKILDMSFNYSSRDYRNKQVMLSGEVYANISTTEIITADGYQTQFNTTDKIGYVQSILINGNPATIITKEEYDLGYEGDFIYQPGNPYFESDDLISTGAIITIVYYAVIEGREVVLNQSEISRINTMTGRKGVIARYENRNDATTTYELNQIGQSYLKYKGNPEIILKIQSLNNIWNIGERVEFSAPLTELATEYMVKKKTINYIATQNNIFYTFELTSSFNSETDINYFDNQRAKTMGNIGIGEYISRNIDIENEANVIFYDLEVNEVQVDGDSTLQSTLQSPLGVE